jgi:hypothetical protein
MKALQIKRSVTKFGFARLTSAVAPVTAARIAPIDYTSVDDPACPGEGWHRVRTRLAGICGSDLAVIEGHASTYFEEYVREESGLVEPAPDARASGEDARRRYFRITADGRRSARTEAAYLESIVRAARDRRLLGAKQ